VKLAYLRAGIVAVIAIALVKALATHDGVGAVEYAVGIAVVLALVAWTGLLLRSAATRK
jgi:hypothetical protein